jgi:hypothetical protein
VTLLDFGEFRTDFLKTGSFAADFDGDGSVTLLDFGIFRSYFLGKPGPSAFHPSAP